MSYFSKGFLCVVEVLLNLYGLPNLWFACGTPSQKRRRTMKTTKTTKTTQTATKKS